MSRGRLCDGNPALHRAADDPYNDEPATPLFHFGHGLSYTTFELSGLNVTQARASLEGRAAASLSVSLNVRNTGSVAGAEVVQVGAGRPGSLVEPALEGS